MGKKNKPSPIEPPLIDPSLPFPEPPPLPLGPRFFDYSPPTKATTVFEVRRGQLASLQVHKAIDEAVRDVVRPGGGARGEQKIEAADKWRKPAAAHAEEIWRESPDLPVATVGKQIRKLLPEDKQPPSDRALKDHIRPLKPQK